MELAGRGSGEFGDRQGKEEFCGDYMSGEGLCGLIGV